MSNSRTRRRRILAGALLCCVPGGLALAQQATPGLLQQDSERSTSEARMQSQQESSGVDRYLASCLLAKNRAELEIAEFAGQRSEDPEVKRFAQQIATEHRQMSQDLQEIAGMGDEARLERSAEGAVDADSPQRRAGAQMPMHRQNANQGDDLQRLAEINQQIVQRVSTNLQQKLREKSGAEFDACFLAAEVACHMQLAAALDVIQDQTSARLARIAAQHSQTAREHLARAEGLLAQQHAGERGEGATRRTPAQVERGAPSDDE